VKESCLGFFFDKIGPQSKRFVQKSDFEKNEIEFGIEGKWPFLLSNTCYLRELWCKKASEDHVFLLEIFGDQIALNGSRRTKIGLILKSC